jgi:hypothetical protein
VQVVEMKQNETCNGELQRLMHKDFFDRCKSAIDQGFYMEAILMEYAAIESRMETLLGVLRLPCHKFLPDNIRKKVQISHRISCANIFRKQMLAFESTKLSKNFFDKLLKWTEKRNEYIHGLYKNELKYSQRIKDAKEFAEKGLEYCRLLYNEVNRLKRLAKKCPQLFELEIECQSKKCTIGDINDETINV